MTLKAQAETALSNLSSFSQAAQTIAVTDGGQELTAKLTGLDALALAFEHITLTSSALADAPIEQLKKVADTLAKRLTYLLEPISPIEVDADQCIVQMRSNPPSATTTARATTNCWCAAAASSACAATSGNAPASVAAFPPKSPAKYFCGWWAIFPTRPNSPVERIVGPLATGDWPTIFEPAQLPRPVVSSTRSHNESPQRERMEQRRIREVSLELSEGWHCSHLFYRFDRARMPTMSPAQISSGREQVIQLLDPAGPEAPRACK